MAGKGGDREFVDLLLLAQDHGIAEYEGGLSRDAAEDLAARAQGFGDAREYWKWLADYVVARRLP